MVSAPGAVRAGPRVPASDALGALGSALALVGLVALVGAPWLHPRFDWEAAADAPNHLLRMYAIAHTLSEGSLYPRWLPDLYLGYGYPLLNYYAPATYYLGAALHGAGLSVYTSFQWSGIVAVALGVTGTFALARALADGARLAALLATVLYLCAPYPFITNLYVRAAVPEALALGLLPWLLLATRHAIIAPARGASAALGLTVAVLMLTHNVSALVGLPLAAAFAALLLTRSADGRRSMSTFAVGAGLGLSLSAFFWLPALIESAYVQLDLLRGGIYDYRTWLFDPLRAGPAQLSVAHDYSALGTATPEQISPWQVALWLVTVLTCLVRFRRPGARLGLGVTALALVCWLLATSWSLPVWERLPLIPYVQFPWRFYGPLALCSAVGAACALAPGTRASAASPWLAQRAAYFTCVGALSILTLALATGALATRPIPLTPSEPPHDINAHSLTAKEVNRYGTGTTSGGEFLPRTVSWPVEGTTRRGIKLYEDAYPQASWQAGFVRVLRGRAAVTQIYRDQSGIAADVQAETETQIALHQLAFPGWRAYLDNAPAPLSIARYEPLNASLGFMVIDMPAGQHRVEARFGPTRTRHVAGALSAAALAVLLLAFTPIGARLPASSLAILPAAALCAVLLGELGARSGATVRPATSHVIADILSDIESGTARVRSPAGAGTALLPPFVERQFKSIRGDERRWLYMHPPSDVTLRLRVPQRAYFQAGLALDPAAWGQSVGDGVRFILEADTGFGWFPLMDRHVHPRARAEEQGWNDVWVPLDAIADRDVSLRLRTEHVADANYDWSGWANPQVVRYHTARPHPGSEHRW